MGAGENGAKARVTQEYSPARPRAKLRSKCLWIGRSCWGKGMELELANKAWAYKKTPPASFPSCMLENAWIKSAFPYGLLFRHEEAKRNNIGVVGRANAELPHYTSHVLAYLMENEMSFIHHVVEWWGCGYTYEDDKSLGERTQWHLMLKPRSNLMLMEWE